MNDVPGFLPPASRIARRERPIRVFGVDLGTTNSSIAEIAWDPSRGGRPTVGCLDIPQGANGDTGPLVPSIVSREGDTAVVGWVAKRLAARMGENGCVAERDIFAETKNDMGLLRCYTEAPPGFRTPPQIASHILQFLHESALAGDPAPADAIAISVPASFQTAQRKDTLAAAELAGLEVVEGTLLDEPTAAFLDWVAAHGTRELDIAPGRPANVLIFDFGGGTCDVAILRVTPGPGAALFRPPPLPSRATSAWAAAISTRRSSRKSSYRFSRSRTRCLRSLSTTTTGLARSCRPSACSPKRSRSGSASGSVPAPLRRPALRIMFRP